MIKNIINDKSARLQKILIILLLASLIFLIPLGIGLAQNETGSEDQPLEEPIDLCESVVCEDTSLECPDGFTASCSNSCDSETGECTSCEPDCTGHEEAEVKENITKPLPLNETLPEENITVRVNVTNVTEEISEEPILPEEEAIEEEIEEPEIIKVPELNVQISYPEKITRGEIIKVKATITNIGEIEATKVSIEWQLPNGFEIIDGNQKENIGKIMLNESFISEISVQTSYSTSLGINEIKLSASYDG